MEIRIDRDPNQTCTPGKMYINGFFYAYTLEDVVRDKNNDGDLQDPGETKVYGKTAIPCGKYEVVLTLSNRFKKTMPLLLDVPGFTGIRIHGGNTDEDTLGCPLIGAVKEGNVISRCKEKVDGLIAAMKKAKELHEKTYITIR